MTLRRYDTRKNEAVRLFLWALWRSIALYLCRWTTSGPDDIMRCLPCDKPCDSILNIDTVDDTILRFTQQYVPICFALAGYFLQVCSRACACSSIASSLFSCSFPKRARHQVLARFYTRCTLIPMDRNGDEEGPRQALTP
jgi:hypothetical protein